MIRTGGRSQVLPLEDRKHEQRVLPENEGKWLLDP